MLFRIHTCPLARAAEARAPRFVRVFVCLGSRTNQRFSFEGSSALRGTARLLHQKYVAREGLAVTLIGGQRETPLPRKACPSAPAVPSVSRRPSLTKLPRIFPQLNADTAPERSDPTPTALARVMLPSDPLRSPFLFLLYGKRRICSFRLLRLRPREPYPRLKGVSLPKNCSQVSGGLCLVLLLHALPDLSERGRLARRLASSFSKPGDSVAPHRPECSKLGRSSLQNHTLQRAGGSRP